ncbi:ASB_collapsed_G0010520.mRNA.1.CDS.1 [Saccharomyces cerevisiae]|nr:ASB_collapsed_G0010520.mRNA.1.CDS.1 [Saccharomyces cerevisiae]
MINNEVEVLVRTTEITCFPPVLPVIEIKMVMLLPSNYATTILLPFLLQTKIPLKAKVQAVRTPPFITTFPNDNNEQRSSQ